MAKEQHQLADMTADDSQGLLTNLLAEERDWSWHSLWQLGAWAVSAVGAVVIAFFALQTSTGVRRDQVASADLARQSQQIQWIAKESQAETRRLSSALNTLNSDRDRLFARVTTLEQGLESVTGSVARQTPPASLVMSSATQLVNTSPPPVIAAATAVPTPEASPAATPQAETPHAALPVVQATAAAPAAREPAKDIKELAKEPAKDSLPASTVYAPPDPAAPKLVEAPPAAPPQPDKAAQHDKAPGPPLLIAAVPENDSATAAAPAITIQRTEFGVDLGGANSIDGLRALWQGVAKSVAKSDASPVASLRPIIVIKERRTGLGLQLRLVAGPLSDAAAAARICAAMAEGGRACEPTVFDGQRLALKATDEPAAMARPVARKRPVRQVRHEEPAVQAAQPAAQPAAAASASSTIPSMFRGR